MARFFDRSRFSPQTNLETSQLSKSLDSAFPCLTWATNSVTVGERVIVVGSPRGLEGTVTAGILSSVREGEGLKVLQTDAAVNPGNSGGPLVNDKGLAVGVISFKFRSAEGLNFAIPINYVRGLLNNLHRPISLKQMSVGLSTASTSDQQNDGPSLEKTLDWLKEKIPLATVEYERSENLNGEHLTQFVSRQGSVTVSTRDGRLRRHRRHDDKRAPRVGQPQKFKQPHRAVRSALLAGLLNTGR